MATDFWSPIRISLEVSVISGVLVFFFGTFLGRLMARVRFKGQVVVETLMLLPLVLPPSVVGFALIVGFGKSSPVGRLIESVFNQPIMFTLGAAVIASSVIAFPLMYMSAKAGFSSVHHEVEEAARIDGANEWKVFWYITLPLAKNSLTAGGIMSFARALGEFGATLMFAGNLPGKTQTVPLAIYIAVDSGYMTLAWLWVLAITSLAFILLLITQLNSRKDKNT